MLHTKLMIKSSIAVTANIIPIGCSFFSFNSLIPHPNTPKSMIEKIKSTLLFESAIYTADVFIRGITIEQRNKTK